MESMFIVNKGETNMTAFLSKEELKLFKKEWNDIRKAFKKAPDSIKECRIALSDDCDVRDDMINEFFTDNWPIVCDILKNTSINLNNIPITCKGE